MIQPTQMSVKERKGDRLVRWLILLLGGYLVVVLSKGLWEIKQAYKRLEVAEVVLKSEEERRANLIREMVEATSSAYIEEVAREELGMQRLGETLVILPKKESFRQVSSEPQSRKQGEEGGESEQNWEKWWNLIK